MKTSNVRKSGREGSAIVLALLMAAGLVVLTVSLFRMAGGSMRRLNGGVDDRRASLLAEAGLNEAYEAIRRGGTGAVGALAAPAALGGGILWVDATDLGGDRTELVATGLYGTGRKALKAVVEYTGGPAPLFQTTLNSKDQITLSDGVLIDSYDSAMGDYASQATNVTNGVTHAGTNGDVRSNVDVVLDTDAMLLGDAAPGPGFTVSLAGGSYVSGSTTPASCAFAFPPIEFPSLPPSGNTIVLANLSAAIPPGEYDFGVLTIGQDATLTLTGPTTIVVADFKGCQDANLVIDASNGPVEILVSGTYTHMSGFEAMPVNGSPLALAFQIGGTADVVFPASTAIRGAYYAPDADIVFASQNECWGAFAANRITLTDDMKLHFDENLLEHFEKDLGQVSGDGLDVLGWCETAVEEDWLLSDRRDPAHVLQLVQAELPSPSEVLEGVP
jgi:hypothetical protein